MSGSSAGSGTRHFQRSNGSQSQAESESLTDIDPETGRRHHGRTRTHTTHSDRQHRSQGIWSAPGEHARDVIREVIHENEAHPQQHRRRRRDVVVKSSTDGQHHARTHIHKELEQSKVIGKGVTSPSRTPSLHEAMIPGSQKVRKQLEDKWGNSKAVHIELVVPNIFSRFIHQELSREDSLADLVVLTGNPMESNDASQQGPWATTCSQYIRKTWPMFANHILTVITHVEKSCRSGLSADSLPTLYDGLFVGCAMLPLAQGGHEISLDLSGRGPLLVALAEALSWLLTVLQPWDQDQPAACTVVCERESDQSRTGSLFNAPFCGRYSLHGKDVAPLSMPLDGSCWAPLFPKTPCSTAFPSMPRPSVMKGVELEFELMCLLCGLDYYVLNLQGILIFGAESLVYPVRQEGNCIQWHFQRCRPDREDEHRIDGLRMATLDMEALCAPGNRHFLGLWSQTVVTLGTELQDYSTLDWSDAAIVETETVHDGFNYGAALSLKGIVSLSWSQTYKIANSRKPLAMRSLDSRLHSSINEPVILYSPSEKRAWMVSFMSVLWHLLRAQANHKRELGYVVPACTRSGNGGKAAFERFMSCRSSPARWPNRGLRLTDLEEKETIQDFAEDMWRSMDCATRQSCLQKRFFHDKIVGFELADFATGSPYAELKSHRLDFALRNSWSPLLDRVRMTFFYEGLLDPILPSHDMRFSGSCGQSTWRNVPMGYNILTASLPCLAFMARDQNPNRSTLTRLAPRLYWNSCQPTGKLFRFCRNRNPHLCPRISKLTSNKDTTCPGVLKSDAERDGAVLFQHRYATRQIIDSREGSEQEVSSLGSQQEGKVPSGKRVSIRKVRPSQTSTATEPRYEFVRRKAKADDHGGAQSAQGFRSIFSLFN